MVNEVKGYDVNFVYKGKSIHVNTESLNKEKIQKLRDLGIEYYGENEKYCFYIPEEKRVIGYALPLPKEKLLDLKVVNEITDFGRMFYYCVNLTSLDVSNWDVSNGENFSYMFRRCRSIISLDVSNWDVSKGENFSYMFYGCRNLTCLDLSGWKINQKADIVGMFLNCNSLKEVKAIGCDEYTISVLKEQLPEDCKLVTEEEVETKAMSIF